MRRTPHALIIALAAGAASLLGTHASFAQDGDDEIEVDPEEGMGDGGEEPEIEIEEPPEGDLEADTAGLEAESSAADEAVKVDAKVGDYKVSWQDIVTVIRKPFLKIRRWDLMPMLATTMNDNMVRHVSAGAQLSYYLTDVLSVGVEGQYYSKSFREPFDLVARQARRLPTINQYNFSGALNFHYVPVYGKFAILDKNIVTWETYFTAGLGITQSEVVPRDPRFPGFTNLLITPNVGASMRFFLFKWMTVNVGIRDYLFVDKFEPVNRDAMTNATAEDAKENADSAFINNVMFQLGISFWLPPTFEYTTFR